MDLGEKPVSHLRHQVAVAAAVDRILSAISLLHCLVQLKLLLLVVEGLAALLCLLTPQMETLALLEETLRLALGFKWLVEVEPELLQPQVVRPAHRQVLAPCFRVQMGPLAAAVLAQVAQTATQQEQAVEAEAVFQYPQQLDL